MGWPVSCAEAMEGENTVAAATALARRRSLRIMGAIVQKIRKKAYEALRG